MTTPATMCSRARHGSSFAEARSDHCLCPTLRMAARGWPKPPHRPRAASYAPDKRVPPAPAQLVVMPNRNQPSLQTTSERRQPPPHQSSLAALAGAASARGSKVNDTSGSSGGRTLRRTAQESHAPSASDSATAIPAPACPAADCAARSVTRGQASGYGEPCRATARPRHSPANHTGAQRS